MTKTGQNIIMHRGDDKTLRVTNTENDVPINLAGSTINYVIYKQNTGVVVVNKTTASGIALTDPLNGILEITLVPVDTESLLGNYMHELEMTDVAGEVSTLMTGSFTILDSKA